MTNCTIKNIRTAFLAAAFLIGSFSLSIAKDATEKKSTAKKPIAKKVVAKPKAVPVPVLGIELLPKSISLHGPEARQAVIVHKTSDAVLGTQIVEGVVIKSKDESIVKIQNGIAIPVSNGTTQLEVSGKGLKSTSKVTVHDMEKDFRWSFRNHVQSVLSKVGCNQGACHGAQAGKKGFKLSLLGYDSEFDFLAITQQSRGRRIVPSDPGRSLLLTKPTGAVPHKGGTLLKTDSLEYRVLAEWIASGTIPPKDEDARLENLEILPKHSVQKPGEKSKLVVLAHFDDGHVEDVTKWAKFTASNSAVATVEQNGDVTINGEGEGAVMAWYLANNVIATITVPAKQQVAKTAFPTEMPKNLIDQLVIKKLKQLNIPPSPKSSDSEFLRRVYLDTIGLLPTENEVRDFLQSKDNAKREKLIDSLLARSEFVDYWTYKWCDLLLVSRSQLRDKAVQSYYDWIRSQVEKNVPWDKFVTEIVTSKGSTLKNGAANFYAIQRDPLLMAETTSVAFLGMSINCARCHDHPLEKWTNDDYYGMVSLFSRVRGKGWGGRVTNGDGERIVFVEDSGEIVQPRTGKPQIPRPLDGDPIPFESLEDRRIHYSKWLTSPENPYFTKAIVNRVWANFLGVGIVEKVDDLRLTNPPSNPELLEALADFLIDKNYDLKSLMQLVLNSETYQRSSKALETNKHDTRYYSHYYPKRIKAEILLDSISQVTGVPTKFSQALRRGGRKENVKIEEGTRAIQLADTSIISYFLETFGRPERLTTCDCERSDEPSMVQVLHLMNGSTINNKLASEKSKARKQTIQKMPIYKIIESIYLEALSRYPTNKEMNSMLGIYNELPDDQKQQCIEDFYWGVLSSKEFLFNH